MTDARLRGEWLSSFAFDELSDTAWRVFTNALMFSAQNGTDGHLPARYLKRLHPDGEKPEAFVALVKAGVWGRVDDGYQMTEWKGALGQSTAEEVAAYRAGARRRAQVYRDRQHAKRSREHGYESAAKEVADVPPHVTRDATYDVRAHVGTGTGTGGGYSDSREGDNMSTLHPSDPEAGRAETSWPVVRPGQLDSTPKCDVCRSPLLHPGSLESGICGKQNAEHDSARRAA